MRKAAPRSTTREQYFEWIVKLIDWPEWEGDRTFNQLLRMLDRRYFRCVMSMDRNRTEDGRDLRWRFGWEQQLSREEMQELDTEPCTVLELMAALSLKIEEEIMSNTDIGNRTGEWFWEMIQNLNLDDMDDEHFQEDETEDILECFQWREYEPDGRGGLFVIHEPGFDMTGIDIWTQMNLYLNERGTE